MRDTAHFELGKATIYSVFPIDQTQKKKWGTYKSHPSDPVFLIMFA